MVSVLDKVSFAKPSDIFAALAPQTADQNAVIATSLERELNRVQGYKVDLTPAESKRLASLQNQISRLEEKAGPDGLSVSQFNDRAELFREANAILGKEYVDVEADPVLKELVARVDTLLEPKLRGAQKKRLDNLRNLETKYLERFYAGTTSAALARQIGNVKLQIQTLTQPRKMAELSPSERRDYDALVTTINARAGTEFLLPSDRKGRAEEIQKTIASL